MRRRLLLLLAVACLSGTAAGFVSTARAGKEVAAPRIPALPRVAPSGPTCPVPKTYRPAFQHASDDSGLPLAMLVAVAEVESRFEPTAVSEAGARGLLQVMPTTAASLQLSPDAPATNVLAGEELGRGLQTCEVERARHPPAPP